jgi:hypothetical protein
MKQRSYLSFTKKTSLIFLILSSVLFSPTLAYALDFSMNATPPTAGKPFTLIVTGCSQESIKAAAGKWGPVFMYQQIKAGVGWTAIDGSFDAKGVATRQLQLNDAGKYNFRFSCAGEGGRTPSSFSGQYAFTPPDIGDYIGGFTVATKEQAANPIQPVCQLDNQGLCQQVNTAIGPIQTDPVRLISRVLSIFLGLSGGIFLLLIIRAGYRLITSQGNPEAIKDAREGLTSAVVGFLFLIFSFVILELIGVHLLQLPGFTQ